jgi:hypothetical protein
MKPQSIINRTYLAIIIVIGLLASNISTPQRDFWTNYEKSGFTDILTADKAENKYPPRTRPSQLGLILLDTNGDVTGVMFLTDQRDFFESRDGTHAFIVIRHQATQHNPEKQLSGGLANNKEKIVPVEISTESRGSFR